jgi:hypothetical protein
MSQVPQYTADVPEQDPAAPNRLDIFEQIPNRPLSTALFSGPPALRVIGADPGRNVQTQLGQLGRVTLMAKVEGAGIALEMNVQTALVLGAELTLAAQAALGLDRSRIKSPLDDLDDQADDDLADDSGSI